MKWLGRAAVAALVLALAGCPHTKPCSADSECTGGYCDEKYGFCVQGSRDSGSGGATGGGTGGGSTGGNTGGSVGGGTGGEVDSGVDAGVDSGVPDAGPVDAGMCITQPCTDATQFCVELVAAPGFLCSPRFVGIQWLTPDSGALVGGPNAVSLQAKLLSNGDGGGTWPSSLAGTLSAGGTVSLSRQGSTDIYSATRTFSPGSSGQVIATASVAPSGTPALDASVAFVVDTLAPELEILFEGPPSYGAGSANFVPTDPSDGTAVRKDETVALVVRSDAGDVFAGSVQLTAGLDGGGWTVDAPSDCSGGAVPFCRRYPLRLGAQPMAAFGAPVLAGASVADNLGNQRVLSPAKAFSVTRWKWATVVSSGGPIQGSPAIGDAGMVFVPVASGVAGLFVVAPDGGIVDRPFSSPIASSPTIGRSATTEAVVIHATTGGVRSLVSGSVCGVSSASRGSPSIRNDGTTSVEAVGVASDGTNDTLLRANPINGSCTLSIATIAGMSFPGNITTDDARSWLADSNGDINVVTLPNGPGSSVNVGSGVVYGLALYRDSNGVTRFAGGGGPGIGRLFVQLADGGIVGDSYSPAKQFGGPAIGPGPVIYAVRQNPDAGAPLLSSYGSFGSPPTASVELTGSHFPSGTQPGATTPVLGAGGTIYSVTNDGILYAVPTGMTGIAWHSPSLGSAGGPSGQVLASPTLDCNRERPGTGTGVLYFATDTGWLVSVIVDSPGLDPTAPWPKYQHDARNTGNLNVTTTCP